MPKKLLFWIDDGLIQFGIAKYLRELLDFDFYAIFDTNHISKSFFENQNLIHFQKSWFFRDYLLNSNSKIDISYLKNLEKSYDVNFMQIAFSERRFYKYNKYHKFSHDEILKISELECKFFELVLDEINPDFVCMGVTDLHRNHLFSMMCDAKKIPVLMLNPVRFGNKMMISKEYDKFDDFDPNSQNFENVKIISKNELEKFLKDSSAYKRIKTALEKKYSEKKHKLSISDIFLRHLKFLLFICNDDYRKFYENWGITRTRFLMNKEFIIPFIIKRTIRESFLNKISKKEINLNVPFVYFPLHHEPERSTLYGAPFWTNQIEVIRTIAKSLPTNFKLYVKEHFSMRTEAWREKQFYKEISDMPNVELIHPSFSPELLLKNCSIVSTITGTTGLEAGFYEKPSIVFADLIYSYLPFVYRIKNPEDLPIIIKKCLNSNHDYTTISHFIDILNKKCFDYDRIPLTFAIASEIHEYNGMTKEVIIPEEKMKNFLDSYSHDFQFLANEYFKKIQSYNSKNL